MYARREPETEVTERTISSVVFSQNGEVTIHTPEGKMFARDASRMFDYESSVRIMYHDTVDVPRYNRSMTWFNAKWPLEYNLPGVIFHVFARLLGFHRFGESITHELIFRDPAQLREYSLAGTRSAIPVQALQGNIA